FSGSTRAIDGTENVEPLNANNNALLNTLVNLEVDSLIGSTLAVKELRTSLQTSLQTSHHSERSKTQNDDVDDLNTVRVAEEDLTRIFLILESR
ncbi:hypothetical protein HAX54_017791, partial [Datura stramonium]|nr:hypothetical protein [Datura stramonium]